MERVKNVVCCAKNVSILTNILNEYTSVAIEY